MVRKEQVFISSLLAAILVSEFQKENIWAWYVGRGQMHEAYKINVYSIVFTL